MSTSNPFEKLQVKHDKEDDDEQGEFEQVKAKDKNLVQNKKKKKYVQKKKQKKNKTKDLRK